MSGEPMPPMPPPPEDPNGASGVSLPPFVRLDEFLDQPDPEVAYRIDQLWPVDGRVVFSAQYKAGKTTGVANLVRSWVDLDPFLGSYTVNPPAGGLLLIDDELHENTLRSWLRAQRISHPERVHLVSLRGRTSSFDVLDDATRAAWARRIADTGASGLVLDCLRPVVDALGLSEDKDTGKVLEAFDALLIEAGLSEAAIVHHMGHHSERSRGDSRLRDWPDAEWRVVRSGEDPADPRYFAAYGRDVDVAEQRLELEDGRRLVLVGGSRKDGDHHRRVEHLVETVTDRPGLSSRELRDAVEGRAAEVDAARDEAVRQDRIEVRSEGRARRHYPRVSEVSHGVPDTGHGEAVNVSRVSIGTRTRHGHPVGHENDDRVPGHGPDQPPPTWVPSACGGCGRRSAADPCRDCQGAAA